MTNSRSISLRPATATDVTEIAACVAAAYGHYVARIGRLPGPMRQDYARVVTERAVMLAQIDGRIAGILVTGPAEAGFLLDNVAVSPQYQQCGVGRALLELAEVQARAAGFQSIYLYTHELMTENQALYRRIGYVEYARRSEHGLARVFMRKDL